jgi:cobalt/nickel transport system permease protein
LLMGSRVLGSVSVVLLLSSVTPAHRIFHSLRWLGVPRGWVEIAALMYRYTFTLLDQTADVLAAQRVRLGYSGLKRSLASLGVLAGAVIVQSMEQATRTYEAMSLRGYQGHMPFGPLPALSRKDLWTLGLVGAGVIGIQVVLEWGLL